MIKLFRILLLGCLSGWIAFQCSAQVTVPANYVVAGPPSGAPAPAKYRLLVVADVPTLPLSKITDAQATLVSGVNIRTVGGVALTGSGDIGTIGATFGGTGLSVYAIGDIISPNTTTTLSRIAAVAAGSYLRSAGVGTLPVWSTLTLPNTITVNQILYATGTNAVGSGAGLTYNGSVFATTAAIGLTSTGIHASGPGAASVNLSASMSALNFDFLAGINLTGGVTMRSTANDTHYHFRLSRSWITGSTGQGLLVRAVDGTYTVNSTGASIVGESYNPTIAGTQTASLSHIAYQNVSGYIRHASVLSVSFDANQTDYNPTGFTGGGSPNGASRLRVTGLSADRTINSLGSTTGNQDGRVLVITNTTSHNLLLLGDDGSTGTAALRFAGATYTIPAGRDVELVYDGTSSRWRIQN